MASVVRFIVRDDRLLIELPGRGGTLVAGGDVRDIASPDKLGLVFRSPTVQSFSTLFLAALAVARLERGEVKLGIEELAAEWWPTRPALSIAKELSRHFASKGKYIGQVRPTDQHLVDADQITCGPYRLNPCHVVEGDLPALKSFLRFGGRLPEDEAPDIAPDQLLATGSALAACGRPVEAYRAFALALVTQPPRGSIYIPLLRGLAGVELWLGRSRHALAHAEELEARGGSATFSAALHLQAIALRQLERFDESIRRDRTALAALAELQPKAVTRRRDELAIELSIAETMSSMVLRREGRRARFVNRLRNDPDWVGASKRFLRCEAAALQHDDPDLHARAVVYLGRHRLRQHFCRDEEAACVERAHGSRSALPPFLESIWSRVIASAKFLWATGTDPVVRASAQMAACREDLVQRGLGHQVRLLDRTIALRTL